MPLHYVLIFSLLGSVGALSGAGAFHNFVDGIVIATAFSSSVPLGIVTSLAVIAHEVPQELGDFVILVESGWCRWSAYWANFVSLLATVAGALVAYFALDVIAPRIQQLQIDFIAHVKSKERNYLSAF